MRRALALALTMAVAGPLARADDTAIEGDPSELALRADTSVATEEGGVGPSTPEASVAVPPTPPDDGAPPPLSDAVTEILDNPLGDDEYRERSTCIGQRSVEDVEVLDDTLLLFTGRRGELWLNEIKPQCFGLEPDMLLRFRLFGGRYCRMDSVRGMPHFGTMPVTPECRLGYFDAVDELQVEALRTAIEERRQAEDMARKTRKATN